MDSPAKSSHGIGANADKCSMPDGYQTCKSGYKVQSHDGDDGDQNIVNHQHVLVAQLEQQGPSKQQDQKKGEKRSVQVCEKSFLFLLIRGIKISSC